MHTTKAILLELQYWPPVQFFTKLLLYPEVHLEQMENYTKGSYRNRCLIASANGMLRLTVPLGKGKNEQQPIREVRIAYREPWQSLHWKSIQSAYQRSPFFEHYCDALAPFFIKKYTFLFDLNLEILQTMNALLGITTPLTLTSHFLPAPEATTLDFRNAISPKPRRAGGDPLFSACHYNQVFEEKHGFFPNLSILDLLFCCGPQALMILKASFNNSKSDTP